MVQWYCVEGDFPEVLIYVWPSYIARHVYDHRLAQHFGT